MSELVKRTYRIRKDQDPQVRKLSVKCKCSESEFVRRSLDTEIGRLINLYRSKK